MTKEESVSQAVYHALIIVCARGEWKNTPDSFHLRVATIDTLILGYRSPVEKLPNPKSRLRRVIEPVVKDLAYGLDVWFEGRKVMFVTWDDAGGFVIHSFKSGDWEQIVALNALTNGELGVRELRK